MKFGYNSKQYDQHATVISPYDHGFLYGMGVFETFRTYNGQPFLFARHIERLANSLKTIGINWDPQVERLASEIAALLHENDLEEAYVRLSVTAGIEPLGLPTQAYTHPNELILLKPLAKASIPETPAKAIQLLATKRLAPETDIRIKSFHYMNAILGKQEMLHYPWAKDAEGIMLTGEGHVAEGLTSNIFLVQNGQLFTPPLDTGILPGVTRQFVMELAESLEIEVIEQRFTWEDLLRTDEVFITNSVQAIVPIQSAFQLDGTAHAFTSDRPVTSKLQQGYGSVVDRGEW